jgi:hypothetical protein
MIVSHQEALQKFLIAHFSLSELRQLITYLPGGRVIMASLPDGVMSAKDFAFEAVLSLERNAALDPDFWSRLRAERPRLGSEITAMQTAFPAFPALSRASSPTLTLLLVRASRHKRYTGLEIVVRNDSTVPQFIKALHLDAQNIVVDYTPDFTLHGKVIDGSFGVSLLNRGWSTLVLVLDLRISPSSHGASRTSTTATVSSGQYHNLFDLSEADIFGRGRHDHANVHVFGHCEALENGVRATIDQSFTVQRADFVPDQRRGAKRGPDTTYICLFDTTHNSCKKTYSILREVPAGQADIFSCIVSADRSASFDLVVELVSADDTLLSTRHDSLAVQRGPHDRWPVKDGDVFTLDVDGSWNLSPPARTPWDP